jgi:nicotinamidase/pyrazinamidase
MHPFDSDILIVVDVQNDFCARGALAVPDGDAVVPAVNRLIERFSQTVLTQDWHPAKHRSFASAHPGRRPFDEIEMDYGRQILWPDHCIQGTQGADFHRDLQTDRAGLIVRKGFRPAIDSYSAFYENDRTTPTGLTGYLREREFRRIILAGLALDYCVLYSALDGRRAGFDVTVVEDACRAIDFRGSLERAKAAMAAAGVIRVTGE